jgi:hypothetical protein
LRLLVRTAEDAVGGGVYLHWWSEVDAGDPNSEGGCIPHTHEHMVQEWDEKKKLTMSMSIAAPGLSAHGSSPHKLPLTLAAGVRVLIVIGSCVDAANANGIPSGSS